MLIPLLEETAKTKWCPFSRVAFRDGGSANRHSMDHYPNQPGQGIVEETRCLGSGCMVWRVASDMVPHGKSGPQRTPDPARGYCGLAAG
jgi:hypothetical protein